MTARTGMSTLISELRGLCEAGTAEYSIIGTGGTVNYWDDDKLQNILDVHRQDIVFEQLQMYPVQIAGGSISYQDYRSSYGYLEATTGGTSVMYLQDSTGAFVGTANYTPDYRRGQFQFSADQSGTVYYMTGRSYDLDSAAADVWRRKASHYANAFDFSTDNHSIKREQVYKHCLEMAEYYEGKSTTSVETVQMVRGDVSCGFYERDDD